MEVMLIFTHCAQKTSGYEIQYIQKIGFLTSFSFSKKFKYLEIKISYRKEVI
jgi:hypothetical protein